MEYWDHMMGPQERVELRANAVLAVKNGEKKRHVARRLGITRQTLHNRMNISLRTPAQATASL